MKTAGQAPEPGFLIKLRDFRNSQTNVRSIARIVPRGQPEKAVIDSSCLNEIAISFNSLIISEV